jgi:uncharacterized DUF497 family protein
MVTTISLVPYDWDPAKRASNVAKHGVDFTAAEGFDWATALVAADTRHDYGEVRLVAIGLIGLRVHVLVATIRRSTVWIISLRKANLKEVNRYASQD